MSNLSCMCITCVSNPISNYYAKVHVGLTWPEWRNTKIDDCHANSGFQLFYDNQRVWPCICISEAEFLLLLVYLKYYKTITWPPCLILFENSPLRLYFLIFLYNHIIGCWTCSLFSLQKMLCFGNTIGNWKIWISILLYMPLETMKELS